MILNKVSSNCQAYVEIIMYNIKVFSVIYYIIILATLII